MKNLLLVLVLLLSGCASSQFITSNQDPIYGIEGSDVEVIVIKNEFELARLLRNDFNFRYDFAQYALSQPQSFDWRFNRYNYNRRYNRYSRFNPYMGYSYSHWDRNQMWNNWVWGYPYGNGIGWSYSWNNNSWSSNSWNNWGSPFNNNIGWNGWNNGYGYNAWHQIYGRQQNIANVSGRRMSSSDRRGIAAMGNSRISTTVKNNRVLNNNTKPVRNNTKPIRNNVKPVRNNNRPVYNNNIPVINNNRPNTNSRPIIRNNTKSTRNNVRSTKSNTRSIKNPR